MLVVAFLTAATASGGYRENDRHIQPNQIARKLSD
jgi:hypothetical protein